MPTAAPTPPAQSETAAEKLSHLKRELMALSDLDAAALGRLFHRGEFRDLRHRMFPRDWG